MIDSLFVSELSQADLAAIEARILDSRLADFATAAQGILGVGRASPLVNFLIACNRLFEHLPQQGLKIVTHWSTGYFLDSSLRRAAGDSAVFDRLAGNVLTAALPDGTSPLQDLSFTINSQADGSIPLLNCDACLRLEPFRVNGSVPLTWKCRRNSADVRQERGDGVSVEVPLPIPPEGCHNIRILPFVASSRWQIPVIPDGARMLLLDRNQPEFDAPAPVESRPAPAFLPLVETLDDAYGHIATVWPEVIPWVRALIPVIADLGESSNPDTHFSGSYGPGLPIYVSRVNDGLLHAEDLIHELQHLRFHLSIPASEWFLRWNEGGFISPYRRDPRPLSGLHLGVHAFLAVNQFRLLTAKSWPDRARASRELLRTHRQNLFVYRTVLKYDGLSPSAARFYQEIGHTLREQGKRIEGLTDAAVAGELERSLNVHLSKVHSLAPDAINRDVSFGAMGSEEWAPLVHRQALRRTAQ